MEGNHEFWQEIPDLLQREHAGILSRWIGDKRLIYNIKVLECLSDGLSATH
jgi:hypothetical protein